MRWVYACTHRTRSLYPREKEDVAVLIPVSSTVLSSLHLILGSTTAKWKEMPINRLAVVKVMWFVR